MLRKPVGAGARRQRVGILGPGRCLAPIGRLDERLELRLRRPPQRDRSRHRRDVVARRSRLGSGGGHEARTSDRKQSHEPDGSASGHGRGSVWREGHLGAAAVPGGALRSLAWSRGDCPNRNVASTVAHRSRTIRALVVVPARLLPPAVEHVAAAAEREEEDQRGERGRARPQVGSHDQQHEPDDRAVEQHLRRSGMSPNVPRFWRQTVQASQPSTSRNATRRIRKRIPATRRRPPRRPSARPR